MSESDGNEGKIMQKFELYIKASAIDKETKGSCPICQQFFMLTCLLAENQDDIDFKVYTVQADSPPKNFAAGWSKKYPVVMVISGRSKTGEDLNGNMYDTFEELEQFFECINRECPELKRKNAPNIEAMKVVENVYKHFNHYIAGQPEKALLAELQKVNDFLEVQGTPFLIDQRMCFADAHFFPRMQHLRVAGKAYRGFEIPKHMKYLWRYLRNCYREDAVKSTTPSDQDIIYHYEKKACNPPQKGRQTAKPTLEKPTYTMDVPDDVLDDLSDGGSPPAEKLHEEEPAQKTYQEVKSAPEPSYDTADLSSGFHDHEAIEDHAPVGNVEEHEEADNQS